MWQPGTAAIWLWFLWRPEKKLSVYRDERRLKWDEDGNFRRDGMHGSGKGVGQGSQRGSQEGKEEQRGHPVRPHGQEAGLQRIPYSISGHIPEGL